MSKVTHSIISATAGGLLGYFIPHLLKQSTSVKIVSTIVLAASGFAFAYFTTPPSSLEVSLNKDDKDERRIVFIKKK